MNPFLTSILPDQGTYFIASIKAGDCRHYTCHSISDMVKKALEIDAQGVDAYFACASFKQESYIDGKGRRRQRTTVNAGWAKSFWLDIDCGPEKAAEGKGYATIHEALAALQAFISAVDLPMPIVVFSGGGLHVYWLLTETITKEQWQQVARKLKALTQCTAIRLITDNSRTSDITSILRPIGTHNYKRERAGAEVVQKIVGVAINFEQFSRIISRAYQAHCGGSTKLSTRPSSSIDLSGYQPDPETPEAIARVKSALALINPDCEYSEWRDICFAVHALGWSCSEGLARSWSKGEFI